MCKIHIKKIITGLMMNNCYVVTCNNKALIVDPGGWNSELEDIKNNYTVEKCLLTHGHGDHIGGVCKLQDSNVPVAIGRLDAPMLQSAEMNLSAVLGVPIMMDQEADQLLDGGEMLQWEGGEIRTILLPGHTPGGIGYYLNGALFCGDQLFSGSIGRTDLPGSSYDDLKISIKQKIYTLPSNTKIYPGHGPETTVAVEMLKNPFVRADSE